MSTSRSSRRQAARPPRNGRRTLPLLAGAALAVGLMAAGAWWWSQSQAAGRLAAFQQLEGRWRRGDGGYILDILGVDADGRLKAAYFNPKPINVSRAEASMPGDTPSVFVELRDTNYPGSTYQLSYDPATDRLRGTYFQAMLRESYAVEFGRVKP